jgi:hypothetical protein
MGSDPFFKRFISAHWDVNTAAPVFWLFFGGDSASAAYKNRVCPDFFSVTRGRAD